MIDTTEFQSTLPMKGATNCLTKHKENRMVSIHAPNEGSDVRAIVTMPSFNEFQSTLPMKGATLRSRLIR